MTAEVRYFSNILGRRVRVPSHGNAVMDAEERRKVQDTLLRAAEAVVRQMRADADLGQIDPLTRAAEKIAELTKLKDFPTQRAQEFQRSAKFIQRDAYERSVGEMLNEVMRRLRDGDEDVKTTMLGKIRDHVSAAGRFGADQEFRASVERRLQLIQLTTTEGIDKRAKAEAMRRTELRDTVCKAPGGKERRRAIRYVDPVLTVEIDGVKYSSINWSIRGVLLENIVEPLQLGAHVRVTLSSEGYPGGGRNWARVVRRSPKRQEMALEFPDISTIVLALMHEMKMCGVRPEPG